MPANRQETVAALLESIGASVTPIPEADEPRADYWVTLADEAHLVEVKTKNDDESFDQDLRDRGIAYWDPPLEYSKQFAKRVRNSAKQVAATPGADSAFRLAAIVLDGLFKDSMREQLVYTLYGITELFDLDAGDSLPCYWFGRSLFAAGSELDGVIIVQPDRFGPGRPGAQLCPNPFSGGADLFVRSALAHDFKARHACIDPEGDEQSGNAFIMDEATISLGDQGARLRYVQAKYERPKLTIMHPGAFHGAVAVKLK